jgi:putative FmdB family regulatory protein
MPIYEYRCKSCEETFEVIQQFGEGRLRKCRECSGKLEKIISRTAFQLKGGGWYAQGYSKSSASPSGESGKSKKESSSAKAAAEGGSS